MKLTHISTFRQHHLVAEQRHIIAITIGKMQAIELRLLEAGGTTARSAGCSPGIAATLGRMPPPASALASLTNLCERGIGGNLPQKRKKEEQNDSQKREVLVSDAQAIISYWGWLKTSNSFYFYDKHVKPYLQIKEARRIISDHAKQYTTNERIYHWKNRW